MTLYAPDVSYFQPEVDDSFGRQWLIFRCCDGDFADPHCDHNAAWCSAAVKAGRLLGWTAYVVYRPGLNQAVLNHVAGLPAGGHVMVDVESWKGAIRGDHSDEINQLVAALSRTHPGRVWAYGNQGDLASIYPRRGNIPVVVASYGPNRPNVPNMVGWQYTDGSWSIPGKPNVSAPFGACDHNELYVTGGSTGSSESTQSGGAIQIGDTLSSTEYQALSKQIADLKAMFSAAAHETASLVHQDLAGTLQRVVDIRAKVYSDDLPIRSAQYLSGGLPLPGAGHNIPGAEKVITAAVKAQVDELQATLLAAIAAHTQTVTSTGQPVDPTVAADLDAIKQKVSALSQHLGGVA